MTEATNGQKAPEETQTKPKGGAYTSEDKDAAWQFHIELLSRYVDRPKRVEECNPFVLMDSFDDLFQARTEIFRGAGSKSVKTLNKVMPFLDQTIRPFVQKWRLESADGAFNGDYMMNVRRPEFYGEIELLYEEIQTMCDTMAQIAGVQNLAR